MKRIEHIFVNGKFVKPNGTEVRNFFNPSEASVIGEVVLGNEKDVEDAVKAAKNAFAILSKMTLAERAEILDKLYNALMKRESYLIEAAILEYGSPVTATQGRVKMAAQAFLNAKEAMMNIEFERQADENTTVVMESVGVVACITPWNANYTHICSKIAPAIAAGCTTVVKPSEYNALETQILCECFEDAGIPEGIINVVNGSGSVIGSALMKHPDVAALSFTGSTAVGKLLQKQAADTMKRTVLELGGKSANILLCDADFEKAIPLAIQIAFSNSGQACHAGSRLLVPECCMDEVKELLVKAVNDLKIGNLQDKNSNIGPMVNQEQYDRVQGYIQKGINQGAELLAGGLGHPKGLGGWYAKPTVFVEVKPGMNIEQEEIFGPVLSVIAYETVEEAIAITNDTIYGLSGYISSTDIERAKNIARQMETGGVFINKGIIIGTKIPFGGFKQSGIGRSGWTNGVESFLETKIIGY